MTKAVFKVFAAGLMFLSAGCAQLGSSSQGVSDAEALRIVAVDLVSVLGQLPGLDPFTTTAQVSASQSEFGVAVANALQDVGYGVQRVSSDQGAAFVQHQTTQTLEAGDTITEFEVALLGARVARDYIESRNGWVPSSPLRVYGVEPTRVLVNDDLHAYAASASRLITGVVFHDAQGNLIESRDFTVSVGRVAIEAPDANARVQRSLSLGQATVFGRQRAQAREDLRHFETVAEVVLRFPTKDPMTLGTRNKQAIAALLQRHVITTDRFVIQGCSQGATLVWDGTESISLERQQRVNKELLVSGVLPEAIIEEGCLSRSSDTQLPQQSVRLQLARAVTG